MLTIVLVQLLIIVLLLTHVAMQDNPLESIQIIAHRGASGVSTENTLFSVDKAIGHKADYIEIDVRRTKDKILVVVHDSEVSGYTDKTGHLHEFNYKDLKTKFLDVDLEGRAKDTLTKLDDVLAKARKHKIKMVLEIKDPKNYPGIAKDIKKVVEDHDYSRKTIVASFDFKWVTEEFHKIAPRIKIGYFTVSPTSNVKIIKNSVLITYWFNLILDPTLLRRAHQKNTQVWIWTFWKDWLAKYMSSLGIDGMVTNHPQLRREYNIK